MGLWATAFSPGNGTLSWGATVESLTELEDANAKLMADDLFVEAVTRGATMTIGGADDETAQFLHNPVDPSRHPTYAAVVRSQLANGAFRRGVEVGIEIAQRATQLSGVPTSFLLSTTGAYGGVGWITAAETLKQLEQAEQTVNLDPDFAKLLDEEASRCYLPGITTQAIWQRIA